MSKKKFSYSIPYICNIRTFEKLKNTRQQHFKILQNNYITKAIKGNAEKWNSFVYTKCYQRVWIHRKSILLFRWFSDQKVYQKLVVSTREGPSLWELLITSQNIVLFNRRVYMLISVNCLSYGTWPIKCKKWGLAIPTTPKTWDLMYSVFSLDIFDVKRILDLHA